MTIPHSGLVAGLLILLMSLAGLAPASAEAGAGRVSYPMVLDGLSSDLAILSTMAMPGEAVRISVDAAASAEAGTLTETGDGWLWRAPDVPGLVRLTLERGGETRVLNVFVLTPWENGGRDSLNGYRIGAYSPTPFRGLAAYVPPAGFIHVTDELRETRVSPHFTLGQFLCKQQPGHDPTYALISPATRMKLEALLARVRAAGHAVDTLTVMSGFRTPWYNASIGNRTTSSRHLFGGAADVYVDADGDDRMDDLTGDGRVDIADAQELARLAEGLAAELDEAEWRPGGIGIYRANAVHGPFVHVDSRGYRARW